MRRAPLRAQARARQQIAHTTSIPAPVGGWNARDALAAMKPTDAIALENWFPQTTHVEVRGGYASHATAMSGNGKTLAVYNALTGSNKLFCFTSAQVYDVSSAGAVGASVAARTDGKHQWFMFGDGTNNYLMAFNGIDNPLFYNGTTWTAITGASSPAITGITTTDIIGGCVFKGRVMLIQKSSLSFWYLPAGAAGGAATELDISGDAPGGGFLMAVAAWTMDGGDGIDDYFVCITSEGECVLFRGTNPASSATWAKVGTYQVGKPLGRKCVTKYGGDLMILTQNGVFPLSAALPFASVDSKLAISYKIENAFNDAARLHGSTFGWRAVLYPRKSAFIVNVPITEDGEHEQYVMNTITKSWCKFKEWDAEDFVVFNEELYFTQTTVVYKAWSGVADNGADIIFYGKQAFSYLGSPGQQKHVDMYRPVLRTNGSLSFLTDIDVDFKDTSIIGTANYTVVAGAIWDTDLWDVGVWQDDSQIVKEWTSPDEYAGYCVSGKLKIASKSLEISWISSDFTWRVGGVL